MSRFRPWLLEKIGRLDGSRERKAVAKFAALMLFFLIIGPSIVARAATLVDLITDTAGTTLTPTLTMVEIGATPVPNPVTIKAFIVDGALSSLTFEITSSGGFKIDRAAGQNPSNLSEWLITDFVGEGGRTYEARARGRLVELDTIIDSTNRITFTIQTSTSSTESETPTTSTETTSGTSGATGGTSTDTTAPSSVITLETPTLPDPQKPVVRLRAAVSGSSLIFAKFAITFPDGSVKSFQAIPLSTTLWEAEVELPTGAAYAVRAFGIVSDGREIASANIETVTVPATAPPEAATTETVPATEQSSPEIELLSPPEEATFFGSVPLIARVIGAQATLLTFEIRNEAGEEIPVSAAPGAVAQDWFATFEGRPGEYEVRAGAFVGDAIIHSSSRRAFKIAVPSTPAAELPAPAAETSETPLPPPTAAPLPPAPATTVIAAPEAADERKAAEQRLEKERKDAEERLKEEERRREEEKKAAKTVQTTPAKKTGQAPKPADDECTRTGRAPERFGALLAAKDEREEGCRAG